MRYKTIFLRYVYSAFFYLLVPGILLRLLWRSRRHPGYRQRIAERFGFSRLALEKSIWVHAVSVGESLIAVSLVKKLRLLYPHFPIVVTTMTPTGSARIQAALGNNVHHVYVPYDLPGVMRRFLRQTKPVIAIIVETELWPNLFAACQKRKIPIVIANARLSLRSFEGYKRISALTRQMLASVSLLMSQGKADADRFIALGMNPEKLLVTGNIKFDLELPPDLRSRAAVLRRHLGQERLIWVAASTHGGEEEIILNAHQAILKKEPQALLILVPRHPERFSPVAELIAEQGLRFVRRSEGKTCEPDTAVFLGDTMGEMFLFYALSDVAFVGGSLVPIGGHNLLEPAALTKPVLSGPVLFNFTEISELLKQSQGLTIVKDAAELAEAVLHLFTHVDARSQQGKNALQVVEANRGALAKHVHLIVLLLSPHPAVGHLPPVGEGVLINSRG